MAVKMVTTPCLQLPPKNTAPNDVVSWLGTTTTPTKLISRTRSLEHSRPKHRTSLHSIRRASSASFDAYFSGDAEFSRKIEELALSFRLANEKFTDSMSTQSDSARVDSDDWNPASIEMKANRVDIPVSLRMIKMKKNQWQKNIEEVGESAVKKAFSSMVFIIKELHSYSLQLRETLFFEDLQGIIVRVHEEIHASFVWLFQQVFSHTPTLMLYIMILLANFTVHSMSNSAAFATTSPPCVEDVTTTTTMSFKVTTTSVGSDTTSVGGGSGGGRNVKPVASGMDGDDWMRKSSVANANRTIDSVREESVSGQGQGQDDDVAVWNSILEEASRMRGDEKLERGNSGNFVSPVTAKIEAGDDELRDYFRTELLYQSELAQEPNNVLLLANYAQFLYLVVHDYDRAEEYFKRATRVEPKDAEAHNKYANFLWQVRNDLWAAEETYLEAISADPTNSYYAANYAHFLWNTGGDDTCFPLDTPDDNTLHL